MRITIWQQFSSNHSNFYWMVGTFETAESANTAYHKLKEILQSIDTWSREHPETSSSENLTPPEKEYAEQYNVEWPVTIDWIDGSEYKQPQWERSNQRLIDGSMVVVGNLVFASNPDSTWMSIQPFKGLLEHFGSKVIAYDFDLEGVLKENQELVIDISFTAPNDIVAEQIFGSFSSYLSHSLVSSHNLPPWHNIMENFAVAFQKGKLLQKTSVETMLRNWLIEHDRNLKISSTYAEGKRLQHLALYRGSLNRNGMQFKLEESAFYYPGEFGLAALIAYLEGNNCNDIKIEYKWIKRENE
jgi:hypothetical protein